MKIVAKNKKAKFNYQLLDKYTAGISLEGWEVKSIKAGQVSLDESFISFDKKGNLKIHNFTIVKYRYNTQKEVDEKRSRQLLLTKTELKKIYKQKTLEKIVIIPILLFINKNGLIKIEFALGKPRKKHDKREYEKEKEFKKIKKEHLHFF